MGAGRVYWGQLATVIGAVALGGLVATQWVAAELGYQPALGPPDARVLGHPIYNPLRFFLWWYLFDAYALYRGRRVSTTELRAFRPVVFDSAARPAGHSCNCTIFFLLLERMGVVEGIQGKGVCGNPFYVDISL
jgi:type IV secretory pathway TraG/TraD family ATPase VirD4